MSISNTAYWIFNDNSIPSIRKFLEDGYIVTTIQSFDESPNRHLIKMNLITPKGQTHRSKYVELFFDLPDWIRKSSEAPQGAVIPKTGPAPFLGL